LPKERLGITRYIGKVSTKSICSSSISRIPYWNFLSSYLQCHEIDAAISHKVFVFSLRRTKPQFTMRSLYLTLSVASLLLHSTTSFAAVLKPVNLTQPLNWVAGSYLFPGNLIAGYNADLTEYNATSWDAHILAACASFPACTSASAFQGTTLKQ
jgi:hypothetical protein